MEQTKGILTPRDIDEVGRYYFVRKAMDAGNVVRLKNGVYATQEGLANTMVDVERIVPGGALSLFSLGVLWPDNTIARFDLCGSRKAQEGGGA